MAYCNKCGAYIPDGQTKCLACGYDEAEAQAASQYAYAYDRESAKRDYESEREKKQEQNRQWAREEYARREQQRAEDRAREEEKKAAERKRQREKQAQSEKYDFSAKNNNERSASGLTYTEGNSRFFAMASYVSLGFLLQKLFLPYDEYSSFHSKQGGRLFLVGVIAGIVASIFDLGWVVYLFRIGYTIRGMINAKNGQMTPLPFINALFGDK